MASAFGHVYDAPTVARVEVDTASLGRGAEAVRNAPHPYDARVPRGAPPSDAVGTPAPHQVSDAVAAAGGQRSEWLGTSTTPLAFVTATEAVDIGSANFAQKTAGANFSAEGAFAGAPRSQIVGQLQSGALTAADVPVEVIVRNGQTLILNTRSATALAEAGVPRSVWSVVNMTGDAAAEARLTAQLARNGLTDAGIGTVRAK